MKLAWAAVSADTTHGYGVVGAELYKAFVRVGADILLPDQFGWDAEVVTALPMAWVLGCDSRPDLE